MKAQLSLQSLYYHSNPHPHEERFDSPFPASSFDGSIWSAKNIVRHWCPSRFPSKPWFFFPEFRVLEGPKNRLGSRQFSEAMKFSAPNFQGWRCHAGVLLNRTLLISLDIIGHQWISVDIIRFPSKNKVRWDAHGLQGSCQFPHEFSPSGANQAGYGNRQSTAQSTIKYDSDLASGTHTHIMYHIISFQRHLLYRQVRERVLLCTITSLF